MDMTEENAGKKSKLFPYAVLTKLIFSRNYQMTAMNERGLNMSQMFVLAKLQECGPLNLTALAKAVLVTNQAMTGITNKLVAEGLIERVYSENNRRQIVVQLTQEGYSFINAYFEDIYDEFETMFESCTQEEVDRINQASKTIVEMLARVNPDYGAQYRKEIGDVLTEE